MSLLFTANQSYLCVIGKTRFGKVVFCNGRGFNLRPDEEPHVVRG